MSSTTLSLWENTGMTIQQLIRFWSSYTRGGPDECWIWTKTVRKSEGVDRNIRYGNFSLNGRNYLAHRVAYQLDYGPEGLDELCVLHRCDNGLCVNSRHLFLGTRGDNNRDMAAKGRHVAARRVLTEWQAQEILDYKGIISQKRLGEMYGVAESTV
jgi:hypothetical protein